MRRAAARVLAALVLATAALTGACNGGDSTATTTQDEPATTTTAPAPDSGNVVRPTSAVLYRAGTGTVEVSGGSVPAPMTLSFSTLSEDSGYDPADVASITYDNPDGTSMQIAWQPGGNPEGTPAVVRIGLGSSVEDSYMDANRTQCRVTLDSLDQSRVSGTFTCRDIPGLFETDKTIGTARGTFTANT